MSTTQPLDYDFEKVVEKFLGMPDLRVYYWNYWDIANERKSILFTICLVQFSTYRHSDKVQEKLKYFMDKIFNDSESKQISIKCVKFLDTIDCLTRYEN